MSHATFRFPLRTEGGEQWCSLTKMGVRRIDIVAYRFDVKEKYSFGGGHRHRRAGARDDVHILIPLELEFDITDVEKPAPKRKHGRP
jgi:hypothetical protein